MQDDRLAKFIYLLVNRYVTPSTLNTIVGDDLPAMDGIPDHHLADWSRELARHIVGDQPALEHAKRIIDPEHECGMDEVIGALQSLIHEVEGRDAEIGQVGLLLEPNAKDVDGPHHDSGPARDSEQRLTLSQVALKLGCLQHVLLDQFQRGATLARQRDLDGVVHNVERVGPWSNLDTRPSGYCVTRATYQGEDREG